jgi:hypothetical protein
MKNEKGKMENPGPNAQFIAWHYRLKEIFHLPWYKSPAG